MSFGVRFRDTGLADVRAIFEGLIAADADTRPLTEAIGQTITESAVHRLAVSNEAPDGTPWPVSARAKAKGGKTQFDTGQAGLAGSMTYRAAKRSVVSGSALPYAAQRQSGGTIRAKPGKLLVFKTFDEETGKEIKIAVAKVTQPAREFLGLSDADVDEITALSQEFYADATGMKP